ncbi:hypothetical protein V8G54_008550 [Vigna mungo]|uniref:Uncharacterized protein n=1 Tax=Vigna mungo TaxID=3915 RepID=A0AAQ3S9B2_VIGMU
MIKDNNVITKTCLLYIIPETYHMRTEKRKILDVTEAKFNPKLSKLTKRLLQQTRGQISKLQINKRGKNVHKCKRLHYYLQPRWTQTYNTVTDTFSHATAASTTSFRTSSFQQLAVSERQFR